MTECVETIAKLKLIPDPTLIPCVLVQGYHKSGDGGGGSFLWDSAFNVDLTKFPEGEDFGVVIKPDSFSASNPGRWRRMFDGPMSVKWFGAKGDMKEHYVTKDKKTKLEKTERYRAKIDKNSDILYLTSSGVTGFTPDDRTKTIVIWIAGTDGLRLVTEIKDVTSPTQIELVNKTLDGMSGAYVAWGTDDTDPIQYAIRVAMETGHTVYLPPGHFLITKTLSYNTVNVKHDIQEDTYQLMRHGLQMFGGGAQVTFLHNEIKDGGATIIIDGAENTAFSFQQTGFLKDFHITSTGQIPNTTGIDMRATWAYTIQNVHVMKMGSDAIKFRNNYFIKGTSDGDACHALHLDSVFAYNNGGWGIVIDAGIHGLSTGKIYIERCWIEQNQRGGIQWTGQIGVIERCGIYANGVFPKGTKDPNNLALRLDHPTPVDDAYGILIKNVKGTSDNLLVTGCEIQGNADVQVMVEVGANIKIIQNEFKADDLDTRYTFPSIDIQVGDGNKGDLPGKGPRNVIGCVIEDNRIRVNWKNGWGMYKTADQIKAHKPKHTVVKVNTNAINTVIGRWWTEMFAEDEDGVYKLVELVEEFKTDPVTHKNSTYTDNMLDRRVHLNTYLHRSGIDANHQGGHVLLPFASTQILVDTNRSYTVDTSKWSKFRFRIKKGVTSFTLDNPTARSIGVPLFLEFVSGTNVDVKAVFKEDYYVGESISIPYSKIVTGILLFDESGKWIPFSPWTCEGKPLKELSL